MSNPHFTEEKSLKGTQTADNLLRAFLNETHAAVRYEYYADQAKSDGYVQISDIFAETASDEKYHAKSFYRFLQEDFFEEDLSVDAAPFSITLGDTLENLKAAARGEKTEMADLYPGFAKIAKEEGFDQVAYIFTEISEVEEAHHRRYSKLIENIEKGRVFKRDEVVEWKCNNCGYIHTGKEAPEECPACFHPRGYFELFVEAY